MKDPLAYLMRPIPRNLFRILLVAYLLLRLYMATLPGYVNDVQSYKRWALGTAISGVSAAYETTGVDYPPLFLYVLWGLGKAYLIVAEPTAAGNVPDSVLLTFLIKSPHLVFDLLLGAALYWIVGRSGLWGPDRSGAGWGRLVAAIYLWNPAVLFGSAYWGQPDGIHSFLAVVSVALLGAGRLAGSGALLAMAALMKPLAAPLVPLLAATAALRGRLPGFVAAGSGGLLAALVSFLPFIVSGRIVGVLRKVIFDVEVMPFTSVNGHNLWWLIGSWQNANAPLLGPLTPKQIALFLFGCAYLALLARSAAWLRGDGLDDVVYRARIFRLAAATTATFFFLSTHMHENHLFMALPLLLAVAGRDVRGPWLVAGCSAALLVNMALHDPLLPHALPFGLSASSPFGDPHLGRPYTWLQVFGSFFNTLLAGAVACGAYAAAWRTPRG